MLVNLSIENFALISSCEVGFGEGLTIITGETGSGKSIILGALSLLLGQKADTSILKSKESPCIVEALFKLDFSPDDIQYKELGQLFAEEGLEFVPELYIKRIITPAGRSRAFINEEPASLGLLKQLSKYLLDIHSQHQNLLLGTDSFQLKLLDGFADNGSLLTEYVAIYNEFVADSVKLATCKEQLATLQKEADFIEFQRTELSNAKIVSSEDLDLEQERDLLENSSEIKETLYGIYSAIDFGESPIVSVLNGLRHTAQKQSNVYAPLGDIAQRLESARLEIKDIAQECERLSDRIECNPQRLQVVLDRLDQLYSLFRKYSCNSCDALLNKLDELKNSCANVDKLQEQIAELEASTQRKEKQLTHLSDQLHDRRAQASPKLITLLKSLLADLGMPNVSMEFRMSRTSKFNLHGNTSLVLLFSANKDMPMNELSKVASGGELSRLMLALKCVMTNSTGIGTIIFDEIDTGVSGATAHKMGAMIKELSKSVQVFAISHLPQVAAKGDKHYYVYKEIDEFGTSSHIIELRDHERVAEIARMLSGEKVTEAAMRQAELLMM